MFRLVYISGETTKLSPEALESLVMEARRKNEQLSITGLLLYGSGNFLQILEGTEETVKNLYEAIRIDRRHRRVITINQEPIAAREFPGWSMGFREISQLSASASENFTNLSKTSQKELEGAGFSDVVRSAISVFLSATTVQTVN